VTASGGYLVSEMEARYRERVSHLPLKGSCLACEWTFEGLAGEVFEAQREHARTAHGIRSRKRSTRHLSSFRQPTLTDAHREEIEAEIARRRRLHGLDAA